MTLNADVSTGDLNSVISQLMRIQRNIETGIDDAIDIAISNGTMIAQSADGSMAVVTGDRPSSTTGTITASGDAAIIAEFGAGDDTMISNPFENPPPVDVYPGSWSEQVGSKQYWMFGKWIFGGVEYRTVLPRQGLYLAKEYIVNNFVTIAQGAIII